MKMIMFAVLVMSSVASAATVKVPSLVCYAGSSIYSFNGQKVTANKPISAMILTDGANQVYFSNQASNTQSVIYASVEKNGDLIDVRFTFNKSLDFVVHYTADPKVTTYSASENAFLKESKTFTCARQKLYQPKPGVSGGSRL